MPRRITDVNPQLAAKAFGEAEQFSFPGWNNETVHGYVIKPAGYVEGQKYPVAFLIHGGPQGSFGNGWSYRWNPETYAGAGYAVVMIDFHGSTGYGQAFTDAISQHWGDRPLEDLQKGWAAAQQKYSFLDGDNACALGASYGGYMINWIAGNWSDEFKCLVNHDGVFDTRGMGYAHRGAVVHRVGIRRHAVGEPAGLSSSSTRSTTSRTGRRRCWWSRATSTSASRPPRACRPSPPCSVAASTAAWSSSRTRTTGC